MKVDIVVSTQVWVNKLFSEGGERWSPKGEQIFRFPVDDSFLMNNGIVDAIEQMLGYVSDDHTNYEYQSHHVQFSPDRVILGLEEIYEGMVGEAKQGLYIYTVIRVKNKGYVKEF